LEKHKFNRENRTNIQKNPEIIIDIKDGQIEVEVFNVSGPNCENIVQDLIKKIGDVIDVEKKDDYYKKEQPIQKKSKQKL
jgi:hypothetical protein